MTDYSDLVNDLREYLTTRQISDLLEAQAKEIAEKDDRISSWGQDNEVLGQLLSAKVKDNEKLRARIAELEAAIDKVLVAVSRSKLVVKPGRTSGGQTIDANIRASDYLRVDAWPFEELREARAALKGERK